MQLAPGKMPREAWRVLVRLQTQTLSQGGHRTQLVIREGVHGEGRALFRVPVDAHLVPPVDVIPDQLFFGSVGLDSSAERTLLVRFSPNCVPHRRTDVQVRHDLGNALQVRWTRASSQFWELAGTLTPTSRSGLIEGQLSIAFPVSKVPTIHIPVRARVTEK
jgi:hypothetical protein